MKTRILNYDTVDSTMDVAKRLVTESKNMLDHPTAIIAKSQTNGRGRYGHKWCSGSEGGLYYSLVFQPNQGAFDRIDLGQLQCAAAVQGTIMELTQIAADVKAPNDVLINGKKVAGVLLETSMYGMQDHYDYLIIGVGINLNQTSFPDDIADKAVSLRQVTGVTYQHEGFYEALTHRLLKEFVTC